MIVHVIIAVTCLLAHLEEPCHEGNAFCISEHKGAGQLRGYIDSTIPLLFISEIPSLYPHTVTVQPGLCRTLSETPKTYFLMMRLKYNETNLRIFDSFVNNVYAELKILQQML